MKRSQTEITSFFTTGILWISVFIVLLYIPVKKEKKTEYKTIQIQLQSSLDSVPVIEKTDIGSQTSPQPSAAADVTDVTDVTDVSGTIAPSAANAALPAPAAPIAAAPAPVPVPEPAPKPAAPIAAAPKPAAPAPVPAPKPTSPAPKPTSPAHKPAAPAPKPAAPAPEPAPEQAAPASTPAQQTIVPSIDELIASNSVPKKSEAVWDDSLFEDAPAVSSKPSTPQSLPKTAATAAPSALLGTAASSAPSQPSSSGASENTRPSQSDMPASSSADAYLDVIAGAPSSAQKRASSSVPDQSTLAVSSNRQAAGTSSMQLSDGSYRRLIAPAKPEITLSPSARRLIDGPRTVTVSFKILSGGSVPLVNIEIQPAGLLPLEVQSEIKQQIIAWRFESAPDDGQARFIYSINKE